MRKKYNRMLLLAAMLTVFAGCGKKNTIVTGNYYYPNQSSESSADAKEALTLDSTEENEQDGTLGTNHFIIQSNDMQAECLTLKQIASGREYVYFYTLATKFLDKYGDRTPVSGFEPGMVIVVGEKDAQGKLKEVQLSDKVWEYSDVKRYSVDTKRRIFKIGEERYGYDDGLYICEDTEKKTLEDLSDLDTLRVTGVGKKLISVAVTTGHGELVLTNTSLFEGSFIQIGSKIFAEITKDMTMELPAGTYTVTVANNGYGGSGQLTIESGAVQTLDLDTLKGEGPQMGSILFAVDVEDAIVQVDGAAVDTKEAVSLAYGVHTLVVTAPGYDDFQKKLFVNSREATIVVGMEGSGTKTEETKTTETTDADDSDTAANETDTSEDAAAGNLAGSLAGSHTQGESASGSTADTSLGSNTDIVTGSSTDTSDSTADYLSTLSELLSALSGSSN